MHMISLGDDRDRIQLMHFLLSSVDEQLPMELAVEYDCSELGRGFLAFCREVGETLVAEQVAYSEPELYDY
ncbi:hypothetical protein P3T76_008179 [Phytophthora citrophthora]|uniref:Uncharacterized protein n=1 Tax=Phytophthora citrophthora TaxID=4793 RepID=A0AAD9GM73_9STRA|nr:hypothetical protein P3T76_008179 [Phytophthora citrophthora]